MIDLDELLKSVSRSFYLSLKVLPASVQPAMGLGYLLCRTADSIADTPVLEPNTRLGLLFEMKAAFDEFPMMKEHGLSLSEKFQPALTDQSPQERILLENYTKVFDAFQSLSRTDQALIQRVVVGVINGMEMDLKIFGTNTDTTHIVCLSDETQLERYLNWIGGEPGRFWNDLCAAHSRIYRKYTSPQSHEGVRFGTGLQMINILRDIPADLKLGRCYIPQSKLDSVGLKPETMLDKSNHDRFLSIYHEMIDSATSRLKSGLTYVQTIPRYMPRMRAAVWWPLMIGLKTLALLRNASPSQDSEKPIKVKRWDLYWLMATSCFTLPSNKWLEVDFNDMAEMTSSSSGLTRRN